MIAMVLLLVLAIDKENSGLTGLRQCFLDG